MIGRGRLFWRVFGLRWRVLDCEGGCWSGIVGGVKVLEWGGEEAEEAESGVLVVCCACYG